MEIGFFRLDHWSLIQISGPDSRSFLNGLFTNDIGSLSQNQGCYSLICNPKGRVLADLYCYVFENFFILNFRANLKEKILGILNKYLIIQEVAIQDGQNHRYGLAVMGTNARRELSKCIPIIPNDKDQCIRNESLMIFHMPLWGYPAFQVWGSFEDISDLEQRLHLPVIDQATQQMVRIESGEPLYGVDFDENTLPQEANLRHALHFEKGCYIGQETIARLEHLGHVNQKLVKLKLAQTVSLKRGDKIYSEKLEEVGYVTSFCQSLNYGAMIALGYVQLTSVTSDAPLWIQKVKATQF